jgi:peptidoglycan hydrolase-like protein with peptidoglycan-binding domain/3D (Asp-Asp-Asp) domain-containing protein
MKKIIVIFLLFCLNFNLIFADNSQEQYDYYLQEFVVSAYYSPLPNQMRYLRGNYEAEIRLNGRGTNGADGTEVFMGMIAAPKSYNFGTKIEIPSLGVGSVHDRGGAIVEKKDYHRIDIWMGHGDQGLTRALNWGMRKIVGKVYFDKSKKISLDYTSVPAVSSVVNTKKAVKKEVDQISKYLKLGVIDNQVVKLKKILSSLGYYNLETNNNYFGKNLKNSLIKYQIDNNIIESASSYGAGHCGIKTRESLSKVVLEDKKIDSLVLEEEKEDKKKIVLANLSLNSNEEDNKNVQLILKNLGYYNYKIDGKFNDELVSAIFAFQKDQGIVSLESDYGAGHFGPKTKEALQTVFLKRVEKIKNFPQSKNKIWETDFSAEEKTKNITLKEKVKFPNKKFITYYSTLALKDRGEKVKELQKNLVSSGYLEKKYVTGYYGNITKNAFLKAKSEIFNN